MFNQPLFPFQNAMNAVNMVRNPQNAVGNMIQNSPQMKQVMEYVNANGGDPKAAFYKLAGEMGVDPEEILKQLRNA